MTKKHEDISIKNIFSKQATAAAASSSAGMFFWSMYTVLKYIYICLLLLLLLSFQFSFFFVFLFCFSSSIPFILRIVIHSVLKFNLKQNPRGNIFKFYLWTTDNCTWFFIQNFLFLLFFYCIYTHTILYFCFGKVHAW